jgi:hypothetical protein
VQIDGSEHAWFEDRVFDMANVGVSIAGQTLDHRSAFNGEIGPQKKEHG